MLLVYWDSLTKFGSSSCLRYYCSTLKMAYVLGVYNKDSSLTDYSALVDEKTNGSLSKLLSYGSQLKDGRSRMLYGVSPDFPIVAAVALGSRQVQDNPLECRNEAKEKIRNAVAAGCLALKNAEITSAIIDTCGDSEAAAEAAYLSTFIYQDLKSEKKPSLDIACLNQSDSWLRGVELAKGQNIARRLMETPANLMTPSKFAQEAINLLGHLDVEIHSRSLDWAKEKNMNAFLSVARGSTEPGIFLELMYRGSKATETFHALVGKGITFDSGGISLKPSSKMDLMKGDMGGAACIVGALHAIASLKIPVNIRAFIPLCENMPSGHATKPGDVVVASNGKSIQIDNTDAEGRLVLADALHYASLQKPETIVDLATLTGAMLVALGGAAAGAFTTCDKLWNSISAAGYHTGDRVWRMPLFSYYKDKITDTGVADLNNIGKVPKGGACTAAAFLREFVSCDRWMHLDIASVMEVADDDCPYLSSGMGGRPTRTLALLMEALSKE